MAILKFFGTLAPSCLGALTLVISYKLGKNGYTDLENATETVV